MKRTTLLLTVSAALVISILLFTFFGCACKKTPFHMEGFADAAAAVEKPKTPSDPTDADADVDMNAPLTPKEKELFEDLKENRLSENDIKTLVQNNVLNEKLVEKFLNKLADSEEKEDTFEGFTSVGNTYACAAFGADQ